MITSLTPPSHAHASPPSQTFIPPSHPQIRYTGRFDRRNPDNIRFDWPGSMIELRFNGTSCAVKVRGDGGLYNVFIGDSQFVAQFDTLERVHQLASGLAGNKTHTLRIIKRYESKSGRAAVIKGFYVDKGKSLRPLPPPPRYRIEFIGGSNLIGFGIEADTIHCDNSTSYSNAHLAFGAVAGRLLKAEYHLIAMSGKGLLRNWRSPEITAPNTFGHYYERTVRTDSTLKWDFNSWTPHVAVTYLGVNDYSTEPHPPKEMFWAKYRSFINDLQTRYPNVQIVCVISSREPVREYVRELVEVMRDGGNKRVHFYSFDTPPMHLLGCDWHPGAQAQAIIGKELANVIRPLLMK